MKFLNLLFTSSISLSLLCVLISPAVAHPTLKQQADSQGNSPQSAAAIETISDQAPETNSVNSAQEEAQNKETEDHQEEETTKSESEEDSKVKQPTPEQIARLEKLALADQLYLAGDKIAAVKLYREAKEKWEIEQKQVTEKPESPAVFVDPDQLSPAGKVFWRNYQQGKEQQFQSKVISSLKLLTTREPQFLPGHIHYAEALLGYERAAESIQVLERAVNLYPNEPVILRAKMNADIVEEQWLDASIMARQYALFNPDAPEAAEFKQLAEEYLAEYQSNLRSSITWNAIGNAIAGTVGFALTGNLFGPLSALETTSLLLQGESAVGEASVGQISKKVPMMKDEVVNDYINQIGEKIASASGREEFDYQFYIVMDNALNAFALPGGKIFINAGAIMKTDSEAELAGLIAHEVSHSALSHGFQLVTKGNLTSNIVSYIPYVGNTASSLIVLNYSRDMEKQADIFGTRILVNAGYAADGVRNLMAQLHQSHEDEDNPEPPAWLSSHPNTQERISYIEELIVDNNLNRYSYEGVEPHQKIKKLVMAKWEEYEKCVAEVDSIDEAKICAGEEEESTEIKQESQQDLENSTDKIEAEKLAI